MITENIESLKIHKLSGNQFSSLVTQLAFDESAIYLVSEDGDYNSDWNQNVSSESDYIANRPCYSVFNDILLEPSIGESMSETTLGYFSRVVSSSITLIEGALYSVTFDGTVYECVAQYDEQIGSVMIGNSKWYGGTSELNNGLPFGLINGVLYAETAVTDEGGLHFFSLVYRQETVYPLDPKYVPSVVLKNGDKELILSSSTNGSLKKFRITVDDSGTITATEVV